MSPIYSRNEPSGPLLPLITPLSLVLAVSSRTFCRAALSHLVDALRTADETLSFRFFALSSNKIVRSPDFYRAISKTPSLTVSLFSFVTPTHMCASVPHVFSPTSWHGTQPWAWMGSCFVGKHGWVCDVRADHCRHPTTNTDVAPTDVALPRSILRDRRADVGAARLSREPWTKTCDALRLSAQMEAPCLHPPRALERLSQNVCTVPE